MAEQDPGITYSHMEPLSLPGEMPLRFRVHYDGRDGSMWQDVEIPAGEGGQVMLTVKHGRLVVTPDDDHDHDFRTYMTQDCAPPCHLQRCWCGVERKYRPATREVE